MNAVKINYQKLEPFIKASTNLKGSENEKLARKFKNEIEIFEDIPSGDSLLLSGKNALKDIIPESSINYIA